MMINKNPKNKGGVLYDISEFINNPLRSGIQRVAFEILLNWKSAIPLIPFKLDDLGHPWLLPDNILELMTSYFHAGEQDDLVARQEIIAAGRLVSHPLELEEIFTASCVLNPELFYSEGRIRFYQWMSAHRKIPIFFIVFDFLPWLHPDAFPVGAVCGTMHYLRLLRTIDHIAFISEATKRDFVHRIDRRHRNTGPVLQLGSDGLGTREPVFSPENKNFTMLGTLEPRKNHVRVLQAFQTLWRKGIDVDLTFVGRLGWLSIEDKLCIEIAESEEPNFRWMKSLKDSEVRSVICRSRATIYPSKVEGYGLPPLESLALGVPVIVTDSLPSIEKLPPLGQIRLTKVDSFTITQAVLSLLDDATALNKCQEIKELRLPLWSELAHDVASWIENSISETSV